MNFFIFTKLGRAAALAAALAVGAVWLTGCGDDNGGNSGGGGEDVFGSFTYGGRTYKTVKIGGNNWMAENLNVSTSGSRCYGDDDSYVSVDGGELKRLTSSEIQELCNKYGRLYTWSAAQSACQTIGWRMPTSAEWNALIADAGGAEVAGKALKAKSGWKDSKGNDSGSGTDAYGFSALPGGSRYNGGTAFGNADIHGYWWSATEGRCTDGCAYEFYMLYNSDRAGNNLYGENDGYSVRCVEKGPGKSDD